MSCNTGFNYNSSSTLPWAVKRVGERKDYGFTITEWLNGDTLSTASWASTPSGLTLESPTETDTEAYVWIKDGSAATTYVVTATLTTATGRIELKQFEIRVVA